MFLCTEVPSYNLKIVGTEALARTFILNFIFSVVIRSVNPGFIDIPLTADTGWYHSLPDLMRFSASVSWIKRASDSDE